MSLGLYLENDCSSRSDIGKLWLCGSVGVFDSKVYTGIIGYMRLIFKLNWGKIVLIKSTL